jgi:hypothetical protein
MSKCKEKYIKDKIEFINEFKFLQMLLTILLQNIFEILILPLTSKGI